MSERPRIATMRIHRHLCSLAPSRPLQNASVSIDRTHLKVVHTSTLAVRRCAPRDVAVARIAMVEARNLSSAGQAPGSIVSTASKLPFCVAVRGGLPCALAVRALEGYEIR